MSDILRRIANAQGSPDNPFTTLPDGKVIELTDHGDVFTGYYKNDDGVYYTEADWLAYQREQEAERLAQLEWEAEQATLSAAREERARKLAIAQKKERKQAKNKDAFNASIKRNNKPLLLLGGAIIVVILVVVLWPDSNTNFQNTPDAVIVDTVETDTATTHFGNAVITGSDVRMRAEPNLQGKIVTFFPKQGERVELLQAETDSLKWAQVRRENGTTGWVFGEYVKVVKSNE